MKAIIILSLFTLFLPAQSNGAWIHCYSACLEDYSGRSGSECQRKCQRKIKKERDSFSCQFSEAFRVGRPSCVKRSINSDAICIDACREHITEKVDRFCRDACS